jgi:methionine transaminase
MTTTSATTTTPAVTLESKLPNVGTTIFTVMSALATQHNAVNLGQGFPDFEGDPRLHQAVADAMFGGHNQYPPMAGLATLRSAIASKVSALYAHHIDAEQVTVTAGATQALLTAMLAVVNAGDEVIVLEPCYDCYIPAIELCGATAVRVALTPGSMQPDFASIAAAITPRTRALVINSPHNPSGTVWCEADMLALQDVLRGTNIILISDEVYEHMVFDGQAHQSALRYPELAQRSFVVSSFGKTYHVTGWKIGYVVAPPALMAEFRKVHQFNVFTVNTPMQHGLASFMQHTEAYTDLPAFYQAKRDRFRAGLANTNFKLAPCNGTYFQCVDIDGLKVAERDLSEAEFCKWLTAEVGVAAVPLSAFYANGFDQRRIRFCFAKQDATLDLALQRLATL